MSESDIVAAMIGLNITNNPQTINGALDKKIAVDWLSRKVVRAFIDTCQHPNQQLSVIAEGPALEFVDADPAP